MLEGVILSNQVKNSDLFREENARAYHPRRPLGLGRALMKAGYGTRKQAEEFVLEGRVEVDGQTMLDPYMRVGPEHQIFLDGQPLTHLPRRYFAFHKPLGSVCTQSDGPGRRLIQSFWPREIPGLVASGRLDSRTSGLMLISNDRGWCRHLNGNTQTQQEFRVKLQGSLRATELDVLAAGVLLPKLGHFKPEKVVVVDTLGHQAVLDIVLTEGKVSQMRRVFTTLHHKMVSLQRTRVGEVVLGDLKAGSYRQLTSKEVEHLRVF